MKKLPIFTAVLYLMALGSSVFAAIVTNETVSGKSGDTFNAAYDTSTATQVLKLSGNPTETGTTTLVNDTSNVSRLTLYSDQTGTTRTITGNGADPIFQNNVDGSTSNLYLGNVAFSGCVINSFLVSESTLIGGSVNISPQDTTNPGALTFTGNGTTTYADTGGAISAKSDVTLSGFNSLSYEGYSVLSRGGTICSASGTVSISNVTGVVNFTKNTALNSDSSNGQGGAIATYSEVTLNNLDNLIFDTNKAVWGGAIYSNNSTVSISNVTGAVSFTNNTALDGDSSNGGGGAIATYSEVTLNNLDNLIFDTNKAVWGGAIYSNNSTVSISNVTGAVNFKNNTALNSDSSNGNGGAIFAKPGANLSGLGSLTFDTNKAVWGGAICSSSGTVSISNVTGVVSFKNNTALNGNGGAIYNNKSSVSISDVKGSVSFIGNTTKSSNGAGGAIYTNSEVTLNNLGNLIFETNNAVWGGAILSNSSTVSISNITGTVSFKNNTALNSNSSNGGGGAIYTNSNVILSGLGSLTFDTNKAVWGGAIYSNGGTVSISNVTGVVSFTNNTALNNSSQGRGGAIYAKSDINLNCLGSLIFDTNKAVLGGAIDSNGTVSISDVKNNVSFKNNTATNVGGAIRSDKTIVFSGDGATFTFSGNTANGQPNDIAVGADGSTISGKSTYSFGGGITGIEGSFSLGISGGANVTFESGSITDLSTLTVDAAKAKVDFSTTNGTTSFSTTGLTLQNAGEFSLQDGAATTLTISGPLTVTGGSKIDFDVLSAMQYDTINADGAITFTDATVFLNNTEGFEEGTTLDIAKSSTSVTEDGKTTVSFANSNYEYSVSTVDDGKTLRVTIGKEVPEPATWVLLALGMVGLMWGRRFRR